MTIKYDLIESFILGVKEHPKKQTELLGMKVLSYEGVPIADCIIMEVENIPEWLPKYITILKSPSLTPAS